MDRKAIEGGNITRTVLCQLEDQIGADGAMFKNQKKADPLQHRPYGKFP